jgi:hypothetical protein
MALALAAGLFAGGRAAAAAEPLAVRMAGLVIEEARAAEAPARTFVLVKNEGREPASFDVVLVDGRDARPIARARVERLAPGRTRTVELPGPGIDPARVRVLVAGAPATPEPPPHPAPRAAGRADGGASAPFVLDPTTLTGVPRGVPHDTWNRARGAALLTPLSAGSTRFELRASGLRPGGTYTLWWVDGMISPEGGPLAPPPANVLRADAEGRAEAIVDAPFAAAAHERLVVAFHETGRTEGTSKDDIGKTIFAHLVGKIPRGRSPRRSGLEQPSPVAEEVPWSVEPQRLSPR